MDWESSKKRKVCADFERVGELGCGDGVLHNYDKQTMQDNTVFGQTKYTMIPNKTISYLIRRRLLQTVLIIRIVFYIYH